MRMPSASPAAPTLPRAPAAALIGRWWWAAAACGGAWAATALGLRAVWPTEWGLWALGSGLATLGVLLYVRRYLGENRRTRDDIPLPTLGAGTAVTLTRAFLCALLLGFLLAPPPSGALAWAPSLLFLLAAVLDAVDGALARRYDHATRLGERLDIEMDAFGVLVVSAVAVRLGQLPLAFLGVGGLYYAYRLVRHLRRRQGGPVHALPPDAHRRFWAGTLFGFFAVVLVPLFDPPATTLAGVLFALPVAAGFLRDGLVMTGALDADALGYRRAARWADEALFKSGPVVLRAVTAAAAVDWLVTETAEGSFPLGLAVIGGAAAIGIALGAAARLAAILMIGVVCVGLVLGGFDWWIASVLGGSILVLELGAGRWAWWMPEDAVLLQAPGAANGSAKDSGPASA